MTHDKRPLLLLIVLFLALWLAAPLTGRAEAAARPVLSQEASCPGSVVIQWGDSLGDIALRCGTTIRALLAANPQIANPDVIYAGTVLAIPNATVAPLFTDQPTVGEATTRPPGIGPEERWIDVDLTNQLLVAYEGNKPVFQSLISSGTWQYPTVTGQFRIYLRYESKDMNGWALGYDYYLHDVPYPMYFYRGFALHGTYWHGNFGTPMSHGCVNLPTPAAEWIYNWSSIGTAVNVHY